MAANLASMQGHSLSSDDKRGPKLRMRTRLVIGAFAAVILGSPVVAGYVSLQMHSNGAATEMTCITTDNSDTAGIAGDIHSHTECRPRRSLAPIPPGYEIESDGQLRYVGDPDEERLLDPDQYDVP